MSSTTSLQTLNLNSNSLTTLPASVFDNLDALTSLDLSGNDIATLPDDAFTGFSAMLDTLKLNGQTDANVDMKVRLHVAQINNTVTATIPSGAPATLTMNLSVASSSSSSPTTTATISVLVGATTGTLTLMPTGNEILTAAITATPPTLTPAIADLQGLAYEITMADSIQAENICERTPAVEASILASVQVRTDDCTEVTAAMLAGITHLNLSYRGITQLLDGDFAGLTAMTSLSLNGNSLTALPSKDIFSDLTALNVLDLSRNLLTKDLQPTVFSGLTALRTLNLNNNRMSELPAGLFNGLTALRTLNLQNGIGEIRSISSLPAGIFDDLTALSSLDLSFNRLTTFPPGIFSNLASLNSLKLNKNSLARVPDTAFSGFQGQLNTMHTGSQDPNGQFFYGAIKIYVYLNQIGNTVTVTVPAGAFKELKVDLIISSDDAMSTAPTTATITLPVGELTGSLVLSPSGGETLTARFAATDDFVRHPGLGGTQLGGIRALRFVRGTNVAGFCDRTAAVRDALLALDQVSNNCYTVTPGQLVGVTTLDLSSQSISALKAGDFAGLTAMTQLNLSGNSLATLPAGVFSGLPALVSLDLGGNQFTDLPNDTFTGLTTALTTLSAGNQTSANANANLSLYLSQIGNTVTATLPTAAFAATTANLTVSSDDTNVADITQTISIPVGQTSGTTTLTPTSSDTLTAAFDATTPLTFAGITPTGLSIATPNLELVAGFCSRTTEVQAAIITAIGGSPAETCTTVTSTHLAGIATLDLSGDSITALRPGDFAGLTTVTEIDLSGNNSIAALPSNLFANLGTVTTLDLSGSGLAALSADTFSGLTALQTLDLSDNSITSLLEGAGAFSSLAALLTLHLNDNAIQIVPTGAFNGLAALQTLNLNDNAITSLDATALDPLAALTSLDLSNNKLYRPPANSFSGPTLLETLDLSDNIIYRLDADIFSSLAALQTLHLNDNGIVSLFATTFSGLTALQTLDLSDNILNALPAGVFNPLVALSSLDLSDNNLPVLPNGTFTGFQPSTQPLTSLSVGNQTDADSAMRVYLFLAQDGNTVTATLPAGAPANLTLNLSVISSGGSAPTTDTIDMAAGATTATITLMPTGSETLTADFAATNPLTFTGTPGTPGTPALTLTGADIRAAADPVPGFCNRTPGVRDGILAVVSADDCTLVTYPMLAGISGELDLSVASVAAPTIISLKDGDFEGLTAVSTLNLQNQALGTLPSGIFNDLTALTALNLIGNNLVTLPNDTFTTGFPSTLTELSLGDQTSADDNMKIRVYLSQIDTAVTTTFPSGAFTPTNVNLSLTDSGGSSPTAATISLATGKTSNTLTVSSTQTAAFASTNQLTYTGAITVTGADIVPTVQVAGFCDRTAQVQATILATSEAAAANNNCLEVSPDMLAAITILNLGRRGITTLQAGDFDGLTALQTLKLNDNGITSNSTTLLPAGLFDGLTSLQNLFLAGNRGITALPAGLLAGLSSLQNFYLNHTGVATLPAGIFAGLSSLQDIYLNHSRITSLPEGLFAGLSSLEVLHIHTNSLPSLPAGIFAGLSSLTDLQLYSNQLTALPANLFNGLSSLQNLYLDRNSIATLPAAVFAGPSSLQNLYLNSNQLTSLPAGLFNGLSSLADLRLDSNQLTTLPAGIFNALTALTALNLAANDIATLPNGTFTDFSATLGTLRLQAQTDDNVAMKVPLYLNQVGNVVTASIPAGAPAALTANLSVTSSGGGAATTATIVIPVGGVSNSITLVPTGGETLTADFAATTPATLDIATLQGVAYETRTLVGGICNRTPAVQNKLLALTDPTFCALVDTTDLAGITTLDLSNAGIESLQAGDFADLTDLTNLNLSGNSLTALPSAVFTDLAKVTTLNLSGNSLAALPTGVFGGDLAALTTLSLSGNSLTTLPAGVFNDLTALALLDLSNNDITTLPTDTFTGFQPLKQSLTTLSVGNQTSADSNMNIPLYLTQVGNIATATLPSGAPANLRVNLSVTSSGGGSPTTAAIDIDAGATVDSTTLLPTGSETLTAALNSTTPLTHAALTLDGATIVLTAQPAGICGRTQQVQDLVLAEITGVSDCADVTNTHLGTVSAALSSLDLNNKNITSLKPNDFAGLDVATLNLHDNRLTTLPLGVFNGLSNLTTLNLRDNQLTALRARPFASLPNLTSLDLSGNQFSKLPDGIFAGLAQALTTFDISGQFRNNAAFTTLDSLYAVLSLNLNTTTNVATVTIAAGAPQALTMGLDLSGHSASSATEVTIAAGATAGTATLTPDSGSTLSAALSPRPPTLTAGIQGLTLISAAPGICSRTAQVQVALLANPAVDLSDCSQVSATVLANVTSLDLQNKGIQSLQPNDFAGLSGITQLNLSGNQLTDLPSGVFNGLSAVTTLTLNNNKLQTAAASVFSPLTNLRQLSIVGNEIDNLPAGFFTGIANTLSNFAADNQFNDHPDSGGANIPTQSAKALLSLTQTGNQVTASLPSAAPFDLTVRLQVVYGATQSSSPTSISIAHGATTGTATLVPVASQTAFVDFHAERPVFAAAGTTTTGLLYVQKPHGICARSPIVKAFLLTQLSATDCAAVNAEMLASITGTLDLSGLSITTLGAKDFAGLITVTDLNLSDNQLTAASTPVEVLAPLTSLTSLDLSNNSFTALPTDSFHGISNLFITLDKLTTLDLSDNSLSALPTGSFAGAIALTDLNLSANKLQQSSVGQRAFASLPALTALDLSGNEFRSLPDSIFEGLHKDLTDLDVRNQFSNLSGTSTVASLNVLLTLATSQVAGIDSMGSATTTHYATVTIPTGAPSRLRVNLVLSGHHSSSETSVEIATGATTGTAIVVPASGQTLGIALNATAPSVQGAQGLILHTATPDGICTRTAQVQTALLAAISGASTCGAVTSTHLAAVTSLDLSADATALAAISSGPINALKAGDFDGLTGLTELDLGGQNLRRLPAGIFPDAQLDSLTTLKLNDNRFVGNNTLLAGTFQHLAALTTLDFSGNQITSTALDTGFFTGLDKLTTLDLTGQFRNITDAQTPIVNLQEQILSLSFNAATDTATLSTPVCAPTDLTATLNLTGADVATQNLTLAAGECSTDHGADPCRRQHAHCRHSGGQDLHPAQWLRRLANPQRRRSPRALPPLAAGATRHPRRPQYESRCLRRLPAPPAVAGHHHPRPQHRRRIPPATRPFGQHHLPVGHLRTQGR